MSSSNKTEKATPHRRQKAREQGQVARSRDLSGIIAAVGATTVFVWLTPGEIHRWSFLLQRTLEVSSRQSLEPGGPVMFWTATEVLRWVAPPLITAMLLSATVSVMQGGFVFAPASLALKADRLSPGNKLKQIFSISGISGFLKSLLPGSAIVYIVITVFEEQWVAMAHASSMSPKVFVQFLLTVLFEVGWKSAVVLVLWSGIDYFLAWVKLEGELKMSKEEVRQEYKETDGNPLVKSRLRRMQRGLRQRQMLKDTKTATVVVTNPTHYAVALRYQLDMDAPIVVAKGRDYLAQEIKDVAHWEGIPVLENKPLAQALFRTVEVGMAIPSKLYTAVAEVLAFVYRAQEEARRAGSNVRRPDGRNDN